MRVVPVRVGRCGSHARCWVVVMEAYVGPQGFSQCLCWSGPWVRQKENREARASMEGLDGSGMLGRGRSVGPAGGLDE